MTGACAFIGRSRLDMRACHPAPIYIATEHPFEVSTPRPPAFTGGAAIMEG